MSSDHKYFNCSEKHEIDYVANKYPGNEEKVKEFLKKSCANGDIHYSTHEEVYDLIKKKLGLNIK